MSLAELRKIRGRAFEWAGVAQKWLEAVGKPEDDAHEAEGNCEARVDEYANPSNPHSNRGGGARLRLQWVSR